MRTSALVQPPTIAASSRQQTRPEGVRGYDPRRAISGITLGVLLGLTAWLSLAYTARALL